MLCDGTSRDSVGPFANSTYQGDWERDNLVFRRINLRRLELQHLVDCVGSPNFRSSKQLLHVVLDAFIGMFSMRLLIGFKPSQLPSIAHQELYEKSGIIHGNININNILISKDGEGVLNDWDLKDTLAGSLDHGLAVSPLRWSNPGLHIDRFIPGGLAVQILLDPWVSGKATYHPRRHGVLRLCRSLARPPISQA